MPKDFYSKKYLMHALKRAGLPFSYLTLLDYERKGIIPKPRSAIGFGNGKWRFYTQEEIDKVVQMVSDYKRGN